MAKKKSIRFFNILQLIDFYEVSDFSSKYYYDPTKKETTYYFVVLAKEKLNPIEYHEVTLIKGNIEVARLSGIKNIIVNKQQETYVLNISCKDYSGMGALPFGSQVNLGLI